MEFVDDLPPAKRGRGASPEIDAQVAEMRKHPGRWCIIKAGARHTGGYAKPYRGRGCETTCRTQPDGTITMYARWPKGKK